MQRFVTVEAEPVIETGALGPRRAKHVDRGGLPSLSLLLHADPFRRCTSACVEGLTRLRPSLNTILGVHLMQQPSFNQRLAETNWVNLGIPHNEGFWDRPSLSVNQGSQANRTQM
jgi:hypothetical protein